MNETFEQAGLRLVQLRAKLKARDGIKEYKSNCEAIREEIARLEAITTKPAVASDTALDL